MVCEFDYTYDALIDAYGRLGVTRGGLIYVAADLTRLMRYEHADREAVLNAHLSAFRELLGPDGTLFVPTATLNLCNTNIVFDPATTPSKDMGMFAEYVRMRPEAVRSVHPFWSLAGIGPRAREVLETVSRHAYGFGSVWQKLVDLDVLAVNIGKPPHFSISVIHHIETLIGVPYRYTKEFMHPVQRNGAVQIEPFYLSVVYNDADIERDHNVKIFDHFAKHGTLRETQIGRRGRAWSFSHAEFFRVITNLFLSDVYCWLRRPPTVRPYQT